MGEYVGDCRNVGKAGAQKGFNFWESYHNAKYVPNLKLDKTTCLSAVNMKSLAKDHTSTVYIIARDGTNIAIIGDQDINTAGEYQLDIEGNEATLTELDATGGAVCK